MSNPTNPSKKKQGKVIVSLPAGKTEIELPPEPARLLKILLRNTDRWMNTNELRALKVNSVPYAVRILKESGIVLSEKTDKVIDEDGNYSTGVKHYKYKGFIA